MYSLNTTANPYNILIYVATYIVFYIILFSVLSQFFFPQIGGCLNFVITLCALRVLLPLLAIPAEEQVLLERFGNQYVEYCEKVSALGPPVVLLLQL